MTDITERRVEFRELSRMVIPCKHCQAELTLDIANDEQFQAIKAKSSRLSCSVCGGEFDSTMPEAIGAFAILHDRLFRSGHKVFFRVAQ